MQLVLPSFTKDIFSSPSVVHFSRGSVGEIAIFKVLQNLVTGDGYKVRSLISDIDPSEAMKMNEQQGSITFFSDGNAAT